MDTYYPKEAHNRTMEDHCTLVPNRFVLARAIARRTNQLLKNAHPGKNINPKLLKEVQGQTPSFSQAIKVALNEILVGDIKVVEPKSQLPPAIEPDNIVVFT